MYKLQENFGPCFLETGSLVVTLSNLTLTICPFYLNTSDCCIPLYYCRVPVYCSPVHHVKAVDWYTFYFASAFHHHKFLSSCRMVPTLSNHHLLWKWTYKTKVNDNGDLLLLNYFILLLYASPPLESGWWVHALIKVFNPPPQVFEHTPYGFQSE